MSFMRILHHGCGLQNKYDVIYFDNGLTLRRKLGLREMGLNEFSVDSSRFLILVV